MFGVAYQTVLPVSVIKHCGLSTIPSGRYLSGSRSCKLIPAPCCNVRLYRSCGKALSRTELIYVNVDNSEVEDNYATTGREYVHYNGGDYLK